MEEVAHDNSQDSGILDSILELTANVFGVPLAAINTVDAARETIIASHGFDQKEISIEASISKFIFQNSGKFVFSPMPDVDRHLSQKVSKINPHLRFYAGVSVENDQNMSLCL